MQCGFVVCSHRIGVKLGEFGYGKSDIGLCEDCEMIERACEFLIHFDIAEYIIGCGRHEFRAFSKGVDVDLAFIMLYLTSKQSIYPG